MACADDPCHCPKPPSCSRAVRLCRAASGLSAGGWADTGVCDRHRSAGPGGATEAIDGLAVTTPGAALATIQAHRAAFLAAGPDCWMPDGYLVPFPHWAVDSIITT